MQIKHVWMTVMALVAGLSLPLIAAQKDKKAAAKELEK